MSTFGSLFRVSTFGESHCKAVGVVIDGMPPCFPLTEADIQPQLDRRRPGQSRITTSRVESDRATILSGTERGVTLGTPICITVPNENTKPGDYAGMAGIPRPGHADYTYWSKYGIHASSGGGRSSARETIGRVAAGAVAEKWLQQHYGTSIVTFVSSVGTVELPRELWYKHMEEQGAEGAKGRSSCRCESRRRRPWSRQEVDRLGCLQILRAAPAAPAAAVTECSAAPIEAGAAAAAAGSAAQPVKEETVTVDKAFEEAFCRAAGELLFRVPAHPAHRASAAAEGAFSSSSSSVSSPSLSAPTEESTAAVSTAWTKTPSSLPPAALASMASKRQPHIAVAWELLPALEELPLCLLLAYRDAEGNVLDAVGRAVPAAVQEAALQEAAGKAAASAAPAALAAPLLSSVATDSSLSSSGSHSLPCVLTVEETIDVRCPHPPTAAAMATLIRFMRFCGDSIGGTLGTVIHGVPIGLGEPVFDKLEAKLAQAMLSLPATKAFEMGEGFEGTKMRGSEHNDPFLPLHSALAGHAELAGEGGESAAGAAGGAASDSTASSGSSSGGSSAASPKGLQLLQTASNHAGGTLGGVSNGADIVFRVAIKPVSTISMPQITATYTGEEAVLEAKGRHDSCVLPRAPPLLESMAAMVVMDAVLLQAARASAGTALRVLPQQFSH